MKEKILANIKAKFPHAKLSAKRLDALAATIEMKAGTDETLIDTTLDALNEIYPLDDIAKDDHIRSTLEGKLKATQTKRQDEPSGTAATSTKDNPPTAENPPDDINATLKFILESNKALMERLSSMEGEKRHTTIKQSVAEKLKEVPLSYWGNWQTPDKEEDIEGFIEKVNTGYADFKKDLTDKGLLAVPQPGGGSGPSGNGKPATDKELEEVTANFKI